MVAQNYRAIEPQKNYSSSRRYELQTPVTQSVQDYLRTQSRFPSRTRRPYEIEYKVAQPHRGEYKEAESIMKRKPMLQVIEPIKAKF